MEEKRVKEIEKKLQVFSLDGLQNLVTLFDILEREDISIGEVKHFISFVLKEREEREFAFQRTRKEREEKWNKRARKCPTCTKSLALRPINTPKGKTNREGYTCHWYCREESCNFEEYTKEDFQKTYTKIMGGR